MAIALRLALTPAEFANCKDLPKQIAWMACHFSPSGPGLSNMPQFLPPGSVLMVDDSTPFCNHQVSLIAQQLQNAVNTWHLQAIILDFQRPAIPEGKALAEILQALPCPVVVTAEYAPPSAPILLPPCPPNRLLAKHIRPYKHREIWLEVALEGIKLSIDRAGCHQEPAQYDNITTFPHWDHKLCCHYYIKHSPDAITFHLQRSREDLQTMLESARITNAIGLWQEYA